MGLVAFFLMQYFAPNKNGPQTPPRPAPTLEKAFAGIAPDQGAPLSKDAALVEITKLDAQIKANETDELSYWSRLRKGLIQQYILGNLEEKTRKSGWLGFGSDVKYYPVYDEIIQHGAANAVDAQAIYQAGDRLWRESIQKTGVPASEAATALELLVQRGRNSSQFLDKEILVPAEKDPTKVPLNQIPPSGFQSVKVDSLRGTLQNSNPQGIPDRLNLFYSYTTFYKIFDATVKFLGNNRTYSYGLAILIFAIITRIVLQPLTKKQYDSMKGMALIAPEMKKIQDRYKGKTDQTAQVTMMKEIRALQQRHGVNPMMGCGLAFVQMPIFFLVVYPMIQHYEPKMDLAGASFLWIQSLAHADIPLLVIYGISMFFSFRLSSTPPTDDMQRKQQMLLSVVSPVLFPFFLKSYPSAFTLYWMTFNVISTFFQWRMIKAADPNKSIVKTLVGDGFKGLVAAPALAEGETPALESGAVPPRPKDGKVVPKKEIADNAFDSSSHETNGNGNGKKPSPNGKSSSNGQVLTPITSGGGKKKRKR